MIPVVIGALQLVARQIQENIALVKVNKHQCSRLGYRVNLAIEVIAQLERKPENEMEKASRPLSDLKTCLDECLVFITNFSDKKSWFRSVLKAGTHNEQFTLYHQRISDIVALLNLEVDIKSFQKTQEDDDALKQDIETIGLLQEEIINLQKQSIHDFTAFAKDQDENNNILQAQLASMREQLASIVSNTAKPEIDPQFIISFFELKLQKKVGSGHLADIYQGEWQLNPVAVKRLKNVDPSSRKELVREINILARLRHPNVVQFYGGNIQAGHECLVLEFMQHGNLYDYIGNNKLGEEKAHTIACDIAKGLAYVHSHQSGIVHSDLKSKNILLDENNKAKLSDFGLSHATARSIVGPVNASQALAWMAPEVLEGKPNTHKSDVYSYGVILWELFTSQHPRQTRGVIPGHIPEAYRVLIQDCWADDPNVRPNMSAVVQRLQEIELRKTTNQAQYTSGYSSMVSPVNATLRMSTPDPKALFSAAIDLHQKGDLSSAFTLFEQAADLGDITSASNVGLAYLSGSGVVIDKKLAQKYLLTAARAGEPKAQYNLARMLEKGDGVSPDLNEALVWYKKSAENPTADEKTKGKAQDKVRALEPPALHLPLKQ